MIIFGTCVTNSLCVLFIFDTAYGDVCFLIPLQATLQPLYKRRNINTNPQQKVRMIKIEFCIIPPVFDFIFNFPKYLLYEVLSSISSNLYSIIDEQPNAKTFLWSMFLYSSWIILHHRTHRKLIQNGLNYCSSYLS